MRPFFPFYGSKWNISRNYPAPAYSEVIEPFAGGAGYSTFYGVKNARLFDKDPIVAGLWRYLIAVTPEEILALPDMPEVGDSVDNYNIPEEAKWLIGFWLNRGSATPKKSRTAYSARTDKAQLNWSPRAKERIASQLGGIRGWTMAEGSYTDAPDIEATWHIDPPYVDKGRYYRHPFKDFEALAEWSLQRQGQVMVCEGQGADWLPFENLGEFKTSLGFSKEVLYLSEVCPGCQGQHSTITCFSEGSASMCACCTDIYNQKETAA